MIMSVASIDELGSTSLQSVLSCLCLGKYDSPLDDTTSLQPQPEHPRSVVNKQAVAMYLMYYEDDNGNRVYTLKVSRAAVVLPCPPCAAPAPRAIWAVSARIGFSFSG